MRTDMVLPALFCLAWSFPVLAQEAAPAASRAAPPPAFLDLRGQQPIAGDAHAGAGKVTVCAACHGQQGTAVVPALANLGGQPATYLYVQLKAFKGGERTDAVMNGQAALLSDADMRDIAAYFAGFPPAIHGGGDDGSAGARLYRDGDPARGIPPCQGCHGADGLGPRPEKRQAPQPPWSTFPHLAGQSVTFMTKALGDYRSGARAGTSNARIMQGVAQALTDEDIQALGAYLSSR
ncbi:c-type cytochrome [Dyella sedimenti]|uniref:c-type cytochrome n=1 Tax=Dyella sedimenti TaxID=2919947 RepID=UPI001FAA42A9|nr:c-type cytochrome [Dyella sedimenti]